MNKRRRILIAGTACLLGIIIIILLMIPFRAWTRAHLAPTFAQVVYGTNTSRIFDKEFSAINKKLQSYEFALIDTIKLPDDKRGALNTYKPLNGCRVQGYEGIHETITCQKVTELKPESPEDFRQQWAAKAPDFIEYLEGAGWQKSYADQPSYRDLFLTPKEDGRWLTYIKHRGKVQCELTVAYNPPYPNPDDQIWIHEQCSRDVKFFGGY